jgi:Tol biopolymer transport system component
VAFAGESRGKQTLWIVSADGGKPAALADDLADGTFFDWSRDSGQIAYTTRRQGRKWVCTVNVSSRKVKTLAEGFNPVYRPDGKAIAFLTSRDVMTVALPEGKPVHLTGQDHLSMLQRLCWSPDGKRIYYSRDIDLWAMNADGSNNRRLVDHAAKGDISPAIADPTVTADGKRVLYSLVTDGLYAGVSHNLVGCYDLAAGQAKAVVVADGWSPAPSGQQLVISIGGKLWFFNMTDGKRTLLGQGFDPAVGPRGKRLAYCVRTNSFGAARIVIESLPR